MLFDRKIQNSILALVVVLSAALFFYALSGKESFDIFAQAVRSNLFYGAFIFVVLEIVSIVIAPVSTVFLIPVAADILGPFLTAILSVVGWTIGSVLAFAIARRFGRPFLERFIEPKKLERYREYISSNTEFLTVLLLRVMFPVDVVSYAVGLFTVMSFRKYFWATVIGITPFSFIYAYGGEALLSRNYELLLIIFSGSAIFLVGISLLLRKYRK